jgi:hypothetical protein
MDIVSYIEQWRGKEIVAYCGPIKYRGLLEDILGDGFLVLYKVAIINPAAEETSEYEKCVLNINEVSGIAFQEVVGRGPETGSDF